jgi:ferric-dicitrate binding protein FerR (iron transport regulator)
MPVSQALRDDREVVRLVSALCDGSIGDEDMDRLDRLLRDDPEAQLFYVRCMDLHLQMDRLLSPACPPAIPPLDPPEPVKAPRPARQRNARTTWGRLALGVAAGLVVAVGTYAAVQWPWDQGPGRSVGTLPGLADTDREPQAGGMAVVARSVRARWDPGAPPLERGATVAGGMVKLNAGTIQLEFYSGATLIVEGPACLELQATDRVRCLYGKLRAHVPPQAHGFTVLSSTAELVDRGTEFGVEVAASGAMAVHVFRGKVELHEPAEGPGGEIAHFPGAGGPACAGREIGAGKGVRVDAAGRQVAIDADARAFLSPADLERQAALAAAERFRRWRAAGEILRHDPRLVAYYPFQNRDPWERTLKAENRPDEALDGAVVGCPWVRGRWPGKGALEYKRPGDRVRVHVPGESESLTFAAWVRVDALEHLFNALCLTDGFEPGAPHWQLNNQGEIILGVKDPTPTRAYYNYKSPPQFGPERLGVWTHLATTYDRAAGTVAHYVDGRLVSREVIRFDVRLRLGNAEIGNWGVPRSGTPTPIRNLNGRVDEFLLFDQALPPAEVWDLYETGKPS